MIDYKKNYQREVSIYNQQQDIIVKPRPSKKVRPLREFEMVDLSLPEIDYRKYRAPLIGKPYPYQSPIDMQNNLLIKKLLNRKYTYERM